MLLITFIYIMNQTFKMSEMFILIIEVMCLWKGYKNILKVDLHIYRIMFNFNSIVIVKVGHKWYNHL